jgi:Cu(I)/Ag(I) efflux system periplasmic protein CusF
MPKQERLGMLKRCEIGMGCPKGPSRKVHKMISIKILGTFTVIGVTIFSASLLAQDAGLLKGQIVKIDEPAGKITIRQEPSGTTGAASQPSEDFGVKDGLLFNAAKVGDKITFSVETVNGQKRISKLAPQ